MTSILALKNRTVGSLSRSSKPLLLAAGISVLAGCSGSLPQNLGLHDGKLSACPESPNCVSSYATDDEHRIDALPAPSGESQQRLMTLLQAQDRVAVISSQPGYVHATFTSAIMRYVDDVEFVIEPTQIHVRSASRLGHSDLGANRKRVENLREQLKALQ
ncbi:DUF1499 domain-containing protein [Atopomonas sediminilitoris]|uniref:DUF1499 domain-containing protein n=1 Tax=Atopomonas sediminilitoris TaxID=2919919 RepID=UPI001F4EE30A|nr:DUF1499 domain-containing protein [Atopomonas sediminilitoris]MCJ8169003.1 DUF1499 domain-containing protein [Atopomonas sediminilitoris]